MYVSRGGSFVTSWEIHSRVGAKLPRFGDQLENVYSNSSQLVHGRSEMAGKCMLLGDSFTSNDDVIKLNLIKGRASNVPHTHSNWKV